jgi:hypothetical protein
MSNATTNINTKMDGNEVKRILNLEKTLNITQGTLIFTVSAICVVAMLYLKYPDTFVKQFGYSLFLTVILCFIVFAVWTFYGSFQIKNPGATFNDLLSHYGSIKTWGTITLIAASVIGLFFGILALLGNFSESSSNANTGAYLTYIIILGLVAGTFFIFRKTAADDAPILLKLPKHTQEFYHDRKKFTLILFAFVVLMSMLYFFNPGGYATKYGGATIFLTVFIGLALVLLVKCYDFFFTNPEKSAAAFREKFEKVPQLTTFLKAGYIVLGLGISALFFYWVISALGLLSENNDVSSKDKIIKIIVNIIILLAVFAIIYKLVNAGGYFANTPLFQLVFNTILYIPCLLVVIVDFIADLFKKKPDAAATAVTAATTMHGATTAATKAATTAATQSSSKSPIVFGNTTKNDLIFFGISVSVCGIYLLFNYLLIPYGMTRYYKQGGRQLINNPLPIDVQTNVATYENLNGEGNKSYQYALSFWFYIDSFPPSTSTSYLKTVPILSYGDNPCVKYHAPSNSIIITVKQKTADIDIVDSIQKLETNIKKENITQWNKIQDKIQSGIEMVKALPVGNEKDENGNRIIYKKQGILLQKWNNIVLNYSGGTLDVFYNGELVKSAIEVVPKINYDMLTVGTNDGISGNIANLIYFHHPLDYLTVNKLYTMLKDKNPPSITTIDKTLIPLPDQVVDTTNEATGDVVDTTNKATKNVKNTFNKK